MNAYKHEALRLAREALVFLVHGYVAEVHAEVGRIDCGLCAILKCWVREKSSTPFIYIEYPDELINSWMVQWPESTKDTNFPVPCPPDRLVSTFYDDERDKAEYAFVQFARHSGSYGELRRDLARFLITKIDEELNE